MVKVTLFLVFILLLITGCYPTAVVKEQEKSKKNHDLIASIIGNKRVSEFGNVLGAGAGAGAVPGAGVGASVEAEQAEILSQRKQLQYLKENIFKSFEVKKSLLNKRNNFAEKYKNWIEHLVMKDYSKNLIFKSSMWQKRRFLSHLTKLENLEKEQLKFIKGLNAQIEEITKLKQDKPEYTVILNSYIKKLEKLECQTLASIAGIKNSKSEQWFTLCSKGSQMSGRELLEIIGDNEFAKQCEDKPKIQYQTLASCNIKNKEKNIFEILGDEELAKEFKDKLE